MKRPGEKRLWFRDHRIRGSDGMTIERKDERHRERMNTRIWSQGKECFSLTSFKTRREEMKDDEEGDLTQESEGIMFPRQGEKVFSRHELFCFTPAA
jgi:hypothetical protein